MKNCVAIGLSGGFLEPLESTAIMTLELQSRMLLNYLPSTDFEESLADNYNNYVARLYEEVRDFLGLHFSLSERKGPYWDAVRNETKKSDSLRAHLELWKYVLPSPVDPRTALYVDSWSILAILMGKNFYRQSHLTAGAYDVPLPVWQRYCDETQTWKRTVLKQLARHNQLIDQMHAKGRIAVREEAEQVSFPDAPLLSQPQPVMSRPQTKRK